jgi:hypothetical protein
LQPGWRIVAHMTTAITLRPATRPTTRRRWSWRRTHDQVLTPATGVEFTWDNRHPGTVGFNRWMAAVGHRVDLHGLTECPRDVDNLVGVARQLGVAPVAVDVLADPAEPDPARLRAFAVVVSALANA